jgi:hypothetical protein
MMQTFRDLSNEQKKLMALAVVGTGVVVSSAFLSPFQF